MIKEESYRILIVDDTPDIHEDFKKILVPLSKDFKTNLDEINEILLNKPKPTEKRNALPRFKIDSAYQSLEAIELVRKSIAEKKPYAVAFVDVLMPPGDDGVKTISQIWNIDPDIQIIICTAYTAYSWEDIVNTLGRSDQLFILKKPFDTIEVLQLACALSKRWSLTRILSDKIANINEAAPCPNLAKSVSAFKDAVDALAETNEKIRKHRAE